MILDLTYSLLDFLILWAVAMSFVALVMMGVDKASAKTRKTRIRESIFGLIAILGGFAGVFIGGLLFHHKTSKPRFWIPVVAAFFLWGAVILVLHFHLITV